MDKTVVEIDRVNLTYHEPHAETMALTNLSLRVQSGEFVGVVGPSGCGKTSMLSLLAGLIRPSSGTVRIQGREPGQTQKPVGYMLQRDHLLDWRNIEGNVMLGLEVQRKKTPEGAAYARELLNTYGLGEFKRHYPRQLSGGMRQKVALIRTLALEPDILLLDEPFSALDYQTRLKLADEVHTIIKQEGKTAILVTHDIAEAISMSDRVLVFTARPGSIKGEYPIAFNGNASPLGRRNLPGFKDYFDVIWKEMDTDEQ